MRGRLNLHAILVFLGVLGVWNIYQGSLIPNATESRPPGWQVQSADPSGPTSSGVCDGYDGLLHIAMGDIEGGVGTALIQLVLGQLDYAEQHNLLPWVFFNNQSNVIYDPEVHANGPGVSFEMLVGRNATLVKRKGGHWRDSWPGPPDTSMPVHRSRSFFPGTGIWNHYFDPVSSFVPGDPSCSNLPYITLDLFQITPGIHGYANWATRCWRYDYLPEYITQPYKPYQEWFAPQRQRAHHLWNRYIRLRPHIDERAKQSNPGCSKRDACLGVHIRHSDKAAGRRVITVSEFLPYVQAFMAGGGSHVFVATDSQQALHEIDETWPDDVRSRIRRVDDVVRSSGNQAVFDIGSHHRTNEEVLVEIAALAECQYMVHGLSAVSESAIWKNIDLHNRSVNLEDPDRFSVAEFASLVQMEVQYEVPGDRLPTAGFEKKWWNPTLDRSTSTTGTPRSTCDKVRGFLLIHTIGIDTKPIRGLYHSILNQLEYAERHSLVPWIYLEDLGDSMEPGETIQVHIIPGKQKESIASVFELDDPNSREAHETVALPSSSGWEHYFDPLGDPGSSPCWGTLPVFTIDRAMLDDERITPWARGILPWQLDAVPDGMWNPKGRSLVDFRRQMREHGSQLVARYMIPLPHITERANDVNPLREGEACLAVHLRNGHKPGKKRKKIKVPQFEPFIRAFVRAGGTIVFVASDSQRTLQYIENNFDGDLKAAIRTQGDHVVRTFKEYPSELFGDAPRSTSEALVDIEAMAKCQFLLHGHSTVSEAVIYRNPALHDHSINLEDQHHMSVDEFETVIRSILPKPRAHRPTEGKIRVATMNNATILQKGEQQSGLDNTIVYLAQKRHSTYKRDSLTSLVRSIDFLVENYLSIDSHIDNTDIFIFHTGDFNATDFQMLQNRHGASLGAALRLVDLSGSPYWARPKHHLEDDPNTWYAYPLFSEGYRRMMHFFAIDIWAFFRDLNQAAGSHYRYLFRLDEDSFLRSPIRYDIFDYMSEHQYVYGFRLCSYELQVTQRMQKLWKQRHPDFVPYRQPDLEQCGFYNNLFVTDLEFFLSTPVQEYLRFIDRQGQIYRRRLGDLMIHSLVVYLFAPPEKIHRFLDFTYEHGTKRDGCLQWGGIQAGSKDSNASAVLDEYYQSLPRNCSVNTTFLWAEDLSPTYASPLKRPLHTITAGRVEVLGKGLLSG